MRIPLLLLAFSLSIASANAAPRKPVAEPSNPKVQDSYKCSTTTWPAFSAVQCNKPFAHNYAECVKMVTDNGWRAAEAWWGCSNQGFKN